MKLFDDEEANRDKANKGFIFKALAECNPKLYQQLKDEQKQHNRNKQKEWIQKNKERVNATKNKWAQSKELCACGKTVANKNKSRHLQSAYHLNRTREPTQDT